MLKILPIMLLSSAQKSYQLCSLICTAICHSSYTILLFLMTMEHIVRLQPIVFYIICYTACSAFIFDMLCSWENLCLILYHVGMITSYTTKVFIKIIIYKNDDQHVNKLTDIDFNELHWLFCLNFPKSYLLCWHYAWCFQQPIIYAQNSAGIIYRPGPTCN